MSNILHIPDISFYDANKKGLALGETMAAGDTPYEPKLGYLKRQPPLVVVVDAWDAVGSLTQIYLKI